MTRKAVQEDCEALQNAWSLPSVNIEQAPAKDAEQERKARILTVCSVPELKVFAFSITVLTNLEADHYEVIQCHENAPKVVSLLKGA